MPAKVRQGATKQRGGGGVLLVPGMDLRAGQVVAGKYRVEKLLGSGASGVVLSARNVHLQERVAIKLLASYTDGQEELMERRLAKARLAARLSSSHVARIVDIGLTEEAMPYVATEWLDGRTLEHELAERGRIEVEQAVSWLLEACEGVAEAHAAGLVHGDLKPQNIFVATSKTGAPTIKLLDFGTTSPLDAIGDQSASAFFGSPAFVSPEQIQNPRAVDHRADVWALGVLLYNLISGSLPFEADTVSGVIVAVVYDEPALLTDAPYELARLVQRCLEKDAANRFQNVTELATALAPFAGAAGARLSDRVQAMFDAPPLTQRHRAALRDALLDETAGSGSVSPVSVSLASEGARREHADHSESHEPLLLVKKRAPSRRAGKASAPPPVATLAPQAQTTRPSKVVVARKRRSRSRIAAYGFVAAASVLALLGWTARPDLRMPAFLANAGQGSAALSLEGEVPEARDRSTIVEVPAYVPRADVVPPTTPVEELPVAPPVPDAPPVQNAQPAAAAPSTPNAQPAAAAPEPAVSFAATSPAGITPTPLAVSPTPLAAEARPPRPPASPASPAANSPFVAPPARMTAPGALPIATLGGSTSAPPPAPKLMTPATLPNAAPASKQTMPAARTGPVAAAPSYRMLNAPPTPLPPPRPAPPARAGLDNGPRSATPSRLPAGLPTSRDALPPYGATPASPAPGNSKAANRSDESYLRKLLTDRK